jgi:hypothetical protein
MTNESGVGPKEMEVAKTVVESKYLSVAAADNNFIRDAGLRCELALDSKTTLPVLTSISETDGLLSAGATAIRANTFAAETGSRADALGVISKVAERKTELNPKSFFICILPFLAFSSY